MNNNKEKIRILIDENRKGRLVLDIIYPESSAENDIHPYMRRITPFNERDFIDWMYEFIIFWKIHPKADTEFIKDKVKTLLARDGRYVKHSIQWEEQFLFSKEDMLKKEKKRAAETMGMDMLLKTLEVNGYKISERTVRYYEAKGLLPKPQKEGKFNKYSMQTALKIMAIKEFQQEGLSIKEILRHFMEKEESQEDNI